MEKRKSKTDKDLATAVTFGLEQQCYKSAVATLERKVEEDPNDHRVRSLLGIAYADLGDREEAAIQEGERAVDRAEDLAADRVEGLARIYVKVGKHKEAIDELDSLLRKTGRFSKHLLRLDPAWDDLRGHPDFKKLVEAGK